MVLTERDAYLTGLGLDVEPPSADYLVRIHRAHVERVPYETLWIQMGQTLGIDPAESADRIAATGRGGYCLHLNGGLSALLEALGFAVTRHVGGIHGPGGPTAEAMTNHLVLLVADLPTASNPGGVWYVDAGLGDALHEPLPLVPGVYTQGPFTLGLEHTPGGVGDWHLTHDEGGAFTGMAWRAAPSASMDEFAESHRWMCTEPESRFVKLLTVQRRDATGVDILRGLTLLRLGSNASDAELTSKAELLDALGDVFGLDVTAFHAAAVDALWERVHAAHERWVAAGRP